MLLCPNLSGCNPRTTSTGYKTSRSESWSRLMKLVLVAALFLGSSTLASAGIVVIPRSSSGISNGTRSLGSVTLVPGTDYESSIEVRNRTPLRNRIEWHLTETNEGAEFNLLANAYSTFIPASSGIDRFGNPTFTPAMYNDSTVTANFPMTLNRGIYVTVSLGGAGLRGLESFSLSYFGRVATYKSDPSAGTLSFDTTFAPLLETVDPLDVADLHETFWVSAGTHPFAFNMKTTHVEGQPFLDGEVLLQASFSEIPEPRTAVLCTMAVAVWRRRKVRGSA